MGEVSKAPWAPMAERPQLWSPTCFCVGPSLPCCLRTAVTCFSCASHMCPDAVQVPDNLPDYQKYYRQMRKVRGAAHHWLCLPGLFPQPPAAYGSEDACMGCPHGREVAPLAACPRAVHTVVSLRCSSHRHVRDAGVRRLREMTRRGRKGQFLQCVQACTRRAASPQGREGGGGRFLGPSCGGI